MFSNKLIKLLYLIVLGCCYIAPLGSFGASEVPTGISTSTSENLSSRLSLNYLGTVKSAADLSPLSTSLFFANYHFLNDYFLGVVVGGELLYQKSSFYSPAVRVGNSRVISKNGFNLISDLRFLFPINSEAMKLKMLYGLQTNQILNYNVPNSKISIRSFNFLRYQAFDQINSGKSLILFQRNTYLYGLSKKAGVGLISLSRITLDNKERTFQFDEFRVGPGGNWRPNKNFMVSLFLTGSPFSTTSAGTNIYSVISANLL